MKSLNEKLLKQLDDLKKEKKEKNLMNNKEEEINYLKKRKQ